MRLFMSVMQQHARAARADLGDAADQAAVVERDLALGDAVVRADREQHRAGIDAAGIGDHAGGDVARRRVRDPVQVAPSAPRSRRPAPARPTATGAAARSPRAAARSRCAARTGRLTSVDAARGRCRAARRARRRSAPARRPAPCARARPARVSALPSSISPKAAAISTGRVSLRQRLPHRDGQPDHVARPLAAVRSSRRRHEITAKRSRCHRRIAAQAGASVHRGQHVAAAASSPRARGRCPAPRIAAASSATTTGRPVASRSTWSSRCSSAPPPVSTMPLSTMSAASSGGVFSSATFTASTMAVTGSVRLSAICALADQHLARHAVHQVAALHLAVRALVAVVRAAQAAPMSILIRSAELSPISRLWLRRM